jgi:hypothetical protein
MAGGITNCPIWQPLLIDMIREHYGNPDDLVIFNPRRPSFNVREDGIAEHQISWERKHLRQSHIILFWFPCETLCPITLFEYGYWLSTYERTLSPRLVVGCHPDYQRKVDLEIQTKLTAPGMIVRTSWDELLVDLLEQYSFVGQAIASSCERIHFV